MGSGKQKEEEKKKTDKGGFGKKEDGKSEL